ncbi:MAG: PPC domain-containing protein [Pseudomonadota bacterium]|nr:PPC domain-containing protein [Pseudomonadota bacterium]
MADIPGDSTTTTVTFVGNAFIDELEVQGDHDWVRIELAAGETVIISVEGSGGAPLPDSTLTVRDAAGNPLAFNDDLVFDFNYNSGLEFTASTAGTYYLDVGSFDDLETGIYQLSVVSDIAGSTATTASIDLGGTYSNSL